MQKLRIFTFWLSLGGHFDEKIPPKNNFFQGCGEKMTITRLIIGLAPKNYFHSLENKILVKIKPKRGTRLQKKNEQSSIFFATVVKIPDFFIFGGAEKG